MIVGLTDPMREGPTFGQYVQWVKGDDADIDVRLLSYTTGHAHELAGCDALVLSGGNDVHPRFYDRMDAWTMMSEVDEERDRFEIALIHAALDARLPIVGICRGAQIFNVARGGSLIPDLPSAGYRDHSKGKDGGKVHSITITPGSVLRSVVGRGAADVNTSHHQAIDRPGEGLKIVASSPDGVVEAAEWEHPDGKSFLLLVQWHPERMGDGRDPVSAAIRKSLFTHVRPTPHHQN